MDRRRPTGTFEYEWLPNVSGGIVDNSLSPPKV